MTMQFVREKIKNKTDWLLGKVKKVACRLLPKEVDQRFVEALKTFTREAVSKAKDMPLCVGIPVLASLHRIFFKDALSAKPHFIVKFLLYCLSVICVLLTIGYRIIKGMRKFIKWLMKPIVFRVFLFALCLVGMIVMLAIADNYKDNYRREEIECCESEAEINQRLSESSSLLDEFIENSWRGFDVSKYIEMQEGFDQVRDYIRRLACDLPYCLMDYPKAEIFRYSLFADSFAVMGLIVLISLIITLMNRSRRMGKMPASVKNQLRKLRGEELLRFIRDSPYFKERANVRDAIGRDTISFKVSTLVASILFLFCIIITINELSAAKFDENSAEIGESYIILRCKDLAGRLNEEYVKCNKFLKSKRNEPAYVSATETILEKIKESKSSLGRKINHIPSEVESDKSSAHVLRVYACFAGVFGLIFGWSFIGCLFGKGPWWPIKVAMGGLRFVRRHWIIFCVILGIVWIAALFMYAVNKISDVCRGRASVTSAELNNTNNTEQINSQQAAMTEQMNQLYQLEQQRQQQQTQMMIMQTMQNMMNQTLDIAPTPSPMPMPKPSPNVEICPIHGCSYVRGIGMGGGCPKCNTAKYGL